MLEEALKKFDKKTRLEFLKADSLRYTIIFPLYLIFLLLLWHWNYHTIFWIFLVFIAMEYIIINFKILKTAKTLLK